MENSEKIQNISIIASNAFKPSEISFYKIGLKRTFDLLFSFLLLPFFLPLLLILIFLVKVTSKGPAIYNSERLGRNGKRFNCFKLRTMCVDADKKIDDILSEDTALKKEYEQFRKLKKDPRVTFIGKFLRSFSLDEIPQIFNIIRGDMSFVGPRPIVKTEIQKYGSNYSEYKALSPGITGLWQVNGRNENSFQKRVEMDLKYYKNYCFLLDLKILFKTIPATLSGKGAY